MSRLTVLLTGGTPDPLNSNRGLRSHTAAGFRELLGDESVRDVPLERAAAALRQQPADLVLVCGSALPDACDYTRLADICRRQGTPFAFWTHEDPYEFDAGARFRECADFIFSNDRWASTHYHRPHVHHLPLAACPQAHTPSRRLFPGGDLRDVFFCGVAFPVRQRIVHDLAPILAGARTEIYGEGWDCQAHPFCRNERLANDTLPDYYATSRLVLNLGRDLNLANAKYRLVPSTPGPRTFEAAMAGACQALFVDSLEVLDYFEPEQEILLFNNPDEFQDLLQRIRREPEFSRRIGAAARDRCLADHTYAARARTILETVGLRQSMPGDGRRIGSSAQNLNAHGPFQNREVAEAA